MSASEMRKIHKPLIEKKRRERINTSLDQLKNIVLSSLEKDPSHYSKLEKADILEMTIRYLHNLKLQKTVSELKENAETTSKNNIPDGELMKYRAGFAECLQEVNSCLSSINCLPPSSRSQLISHLANRLIGINNYSMNSTGCQTQSFNLSTILNCNQETTDNKKTLETEESSRNMEKIRRRYSGGNRTKPLPEYRGKILSRSRQSDEYKEIKNLACWRPW